MKKTFKQFVGILGAAVLFVQPVMAAERGANFELSREIVQKTASVNEDSIRTEINRLDAIRILLESNNNMLKQGSYQFAGVTNTSQLINTSGEEAELNMSVRTEAAFEAPDTIFLKTITEFFGEEMIAEIYFADANMYIRDLSQEDAQWVHFGEYDFSLAVSDATKILTEDQIKSLFSRIDFGERMDINSDQYHVIQVEIDRDKYKEIMSNEMEAIQAQMDAVSNMMINDQNLMEEDLIDMRQALEDVLNNTEASMKYRYIIDARTMLLARVMYEMEVSLHMNIAGENIGVAMVADGYFSFSGYGEEFEFPTV